MEGKRGCLSKNVMDHQDKDQAISTLIDIKCAFSEVRIDEVNRENTWECQGTLKLRSLHVRGYSRLDGHCIAIRELTCFCFYCNIRLLIVFSCLLTLEMRSPLWEESFNTLPNIYTWFFNSK